MVRTRETRRTEEGKEVMADATEGGVPAAGGALSGAATQNAVIKRQRALQAANKSLTPYNPKKRISPGGPPGDAGVPKS